MSDLVVYSVKVDREDLAGAKRFFGRQGLLLQNAVRGLARMAAQCDLCLTQVESGASVSEIQSSLASMLAGAQDVWRLNGAFRDVVLMAAQRSNVSEDFIVNVLSEAERVNRSREVERR
jgi:hypothetical protein